MTTPPNLPRVDFDHEFLRLKMGLWRTKHTLKVKMGLHKLSEGKVANKKYEGREENSFELTLTHTSDDSPRHFAEAIESWMNSQPELAPFWPEVKQTLAFWLPIPEWKEANP